MVFLVSQSGALVAADINKKIQATDFNAFLLEIRQKSSLACY